MRPDLLPVPPARLRLVDTAAAFDQAGEMRAHGIQADLQERCRLLCASLSRTGLEHLELAKQANTRRVDIVDPRRRRRSTMRDGRRFRPMRRASPHAGWTRTNLTDGLTARTMAKGWRN